MSANLCCIIRIYGEPKPQPRPRAFGRKQGKKFIVRAYNPATAEGWKSAIAEAAQERLPTTPLTGPIRMHATFIFRRPLWHFFKTSGLLKPGAPDWHTIKPDRDNLEKAVLDTLTRLGIWGDDCQVCAGEVTKRYTKPQERPGAILIITPLNPAPTPTAA